MKSLQLLGAIVGLCVVGAVCAATRQPGTQPAVQPGGKAPASAQPENKPPTPKVNSAIIPVARENESWWMPRHEAVLKRVHEGDVGLIFIGDSITHGWEDKGKAEWEKRYAPLKAVNMGFSGDRTQHVLWRLDHGEIDGIKPKAAVVMIGTNNSNGADNTAEEIAAGIRSIVDELRTKLPETKVLLLAIFPRGEHPNPQREKLAAVNAAISSLGDGKHVFYLDIGPQFLERDGTLPASVMPDFLHPNEKGYQIWADAIDAKLSELMK